MRMSPFSVSSDTRGVTLSSVLRLTSVQLQGTAEVVPASFSPLELRHGAPATETPLDAGGFRGRFADPSAAMVAGELRSMALQPDFRHAIETVSRIDAVPGILYVVRRITGMRFVAVARVTETRWICSSSLDDLGFGLEPRG